MSNVTASQENLRIAQRIQEKFDAYLLGLIFTVLGLSIQTAKFGASRYADLLELLAWVLLLVAGLVGLSRLEWVPEISRLHSLSDEQTELRRAAEEAQVKGARELNVVPSGKVVSIEQCIADAKASGAKVEAHLAPIEKQAKQKYHLMKWGFVAGLALLICARGIVPLTHALAEGTSCGGTGGGIGAKATARPPN